MQETSGHTVQSLSEAKLESLSLDITAAYFCLYLFKTEVSEFKMLGCRYESLRSTNPRALPLSLATIPC